MSRRKDSDPQLERRWRNLVAVWQRSRQSIRDFCLYHDLSVLSFYSVATRDRSP